MFKEIKSVGVYCGARSGNNPFWNKMAFQVGEAIAVRNRTLVYGGGKVGLMGQLANGARTGNGKIIGVIPTFLNTVEIKDTNITELIEVSNMGERKIILEEKSDAFLILPGGIGTLDEFSEMVTGYQLNMHCKPTYILNELNFYDGLIQQLKTYLQEGFLDEASYQCLKVFPKLEDFVRFMDA